VGQDALALQKAEVFAKIAAAIAATGFVTEDAFAEAGPEPADTKATGKASLERKPEPKKVVVGTTKPEEMPKPITPAAPETVPEWLDSDAFVTLKELENEPADKKQERLDYLKKVYGPTLMKDLPQETFNYFHLEKRELDLMKYWLGTWKADVERWLIKAATEVSNNRVTTIGELTVEEYLTKLIPAIGHMNYLLSCEEDQRADMLQVLNQISKGSVKKLDDLRFRNIKFLRISFDSFINGTFDEIEKVS